MASSRWRQDPEVGELIAHFNQEDKYDNWNALTKAELDTIFAEIDRCRKDFVYAARNYFWITNKQRGDQLFSLWPSQELILQKIMEMKAKGLPQKIIIIKARQLGCSTLIEALIAWRTIFFSGVNALIVSYDRDHTANVLFPIMCFILDRLPWWMQPLWSSRKADEGIFFENPDYKSRAQDPGLNSRIYVKGANSTTGVGQGIRLSAVHGSEFCDWEDATAKDIIDEDMTNALVEDSGTFAILESTAKGANRYAHKLWKKCMDLLGSNRSEWYPLFLPWFFEESRVRVVMPEFRLEKPDIQMRERVTNEWVRCDNKACRQYHYRYIGGEDRAETVCVTCEEGFVHAYVLTNEQLAWIQHRRVNAARDDESMKKLLQEMASSAEEAFQVTGYQVFGQHSQEFANSQVRPPIAMGDFDKAGRLHGQDTRRGKTEQGYFPCFQQDCPLNHEYDDKPLLIWEWPKPGAEYCVGADLAEGLGGRAAYSVGSVIRLGAPGHGDAQVAVYRTNTTGPIPFASKLNHLGLYYQHALMAVECNKYDIVIGQLRFQYNYDNMYRWKHLDSMNVMTNKLGWWTSISSRPRLWQTFKSWLQQEMFFVRSHNLAEEMKNFVKDDEEDVYAGGDREEFDDELMATMIALYTAHETDYNDSLGMAVPTQELTLENAEYRVTCMSCAHLWPTNKVEDKAINPSEFVPSLDANRRATDSGGIRCPVCGSRLVSINRNAAMNPGRSYEDSLWSEAASGWSPDKEWSNADQTEYDLL